MQKKLRNQAIGLFLQKTEGPYECGFASTPWTRGQDPYRRESANAGSVDCKKCISRALDH